MALRNDESISELGRRLYELMDEKKIRSPKDLAKVLYKLELVHVKTRDNFNSPERDRDNAILSIEKKIVRHIKSGMMVDSQGEYLLAYCKFFQCSSDYIMGLTNIRTPNIEARRICELIGLPEETVLELIELNKDELRPVQGCWSMLMKSSLFHSLPVDIVAMGNELRLMYQREAEIKALEWERGIVSGPDLMDINLDIEGKQEELESRRSAFYGLLSKASRNVEDTIEDDLKASFEKFRTMFTEAMLNKTKERYN